MWFQQDGDILWPELADKFLCFNTLELLAMGLAKDTGLYQKANIETLKIEIRWTKYRHMYITILLPISSKD